MAMPAPLQIVVISLAGSARRPRMQQAMEALGLTWRFFDACTGAGAQPYDPERAMRLWGRPMTGGEVGCAASHLAVIQQAASDPDHGWTLVLEDDVALDPLFDLRAATALCEDMGLDYLRLYARFLAPSRTLAWLGQRQLVRFLRSPMGSQAYLISRRGAAGASPRMSRIERPVDWELDRFWHNGLTNYALFPFPLLELGSASTVSKVPSGPEAKPTPFQRLYRLAYRTWEYIRRDLANLRLRAQEAALKRRLAASTWAF
jgi:GR25 family glycosyltransferase involved in LPS biosynthesis